MTLRTPELGKTTVAPASTTEVRGAALDRYDVAILHELQADARLSNAELAARIGLSAAPTWRRVKWLEEQGYITGYRAETIRALPEVMACHYISGAGTFELHVVATDLDAFSRWTMSTLFKLPNVKDLHTSFSLGEVKAGSAVPLEHLGRGG